MGAVFFVRPIWTIILNFMVEVSSWFYCPKQNNKTNKLNPSHNSYGSLLQNESAAEQVTLRLLGCFV